MSKADEVYNQLIKKISEEGHTDKGMQVRPKYEDDTPAYTKSLFGVQVEFGEGTPPLLTGKKVAARTAIREMLLFWSKQTVQETDFKENKVKVWDEWFNANGNLGRSYAYQFESHRDHIREIVKVKPLTGLKHGPLKDIVVGEPLPVNTDCKDPVVGNVYSNSKGRKFTVLDMFKAQDDRHSLQIARIQFHNTNNVVEAYKSHVVKGKVMDNYSRTFCEVGYMGNYTSVKNFTKDELSYLKKLWRGMLSRCYNPKGTGFSNYGGRGVFVDERWHSFENFLRDVRYLPHFFFARENKFKDYQLDKDYFGANYYSVDTCVWLTKQENLLYQRCRPFNLYKDNENLGVFISAAAAGERFGFHGTNLTRVLQGKKESIKGFTASYVTDTENLYRLELSRNQVVELLRGIRSNAASRRLLTSFWNDADVDKKELQECAWSTQWRVVIDRLDLILIQRSGDAGLGVPFNWIQYWILQKMIAQVTGLKHGRFIHQLGDIHFYDRHEEVLLEQIGLPKFKEPIIKLNPSIFDFFDFTEDDVIIENYEHGPFLRMEVAI